VERSFFLGLPPLLPVTRCASRILSVHDVVPPAPMNRVKYLSAGPSKMPLRCWYNCGTNHFHQADFCLAEMNKPTMLSNKSSTAWSCAENQIFVRFLRIKSSEQDFKYLY